MQTTLLGLAIALIVALVAALLGPLFVDWSSHRTLFEAEASRLIGVNVRVDGTIDARLLPSPRLTLHDIAIGNGQDTIRARSLGVEFALGPLMRGEWRAADLHIEGPQLSLGLDSDGRLRAPNLAVNFRADELSVDRLSIVDGTLLLTDAKSGASMTLSRLWFNGEARSLLGPVKGEGAATIAGELYPYRLSVGRLTDDGASRLRINVDPVEHPLSIEADGTVTLATGSPRFEGTLALSRPVGIAASSSGHPVEALTQPWRASAKIKVTSQSALLQNIDIQYGSDEKGYRLAGTADFKFGARPRFDGVLSGRQIDIDRATGSRQAPVSVIRQLAGLGALAIRPGLPVKFGIGIDQVTIGGNALQNLRADISSSNGGWNLDHLEFRAPGITQVALSGRLVDENGGLTFTGPAEVDVSDPKLLAAWLEGRDDPTQGELRPLKVRGDVSLASGKITVDRLKAELDRRAFSGRVTYVFPPTGQIARLDAVLDAPQIDIDAAMDLGRAVFAGSNLTRPQDVALVANFGRVTYSGIEARDAYVKLKIDGYGLQLDRLSIGDLGGGSVLASGRIDTGGHSPRGAISIDLESRQVGDLVAIGTRFAPGFFARTSETLKRIGHARLHGSLDVSDGDTAAESRAQLAINGDLDDLRVDARTVVSGDWSTWRASRAEFDATVKAPDGAVLVRLLDLDAFVATDTGPGELKVHVSGPPVGDLALDLALSAGQFDARLSGSGQYLGEGRLKGTGTLRMDKAALRPLRPGLTEISSRLPARLAARLKVSGGEVTFDDIDATVNDARIRGRLAIAAGSPHHVDGALEADSASLPALIASAAGWPAAGATQRGWNWSREPFSPGVFGQLSGKVAIEFGRAELMPSLTAREVRAILNFDKNAISLDHVTGNLAGGAFEGVLTVQTAEDGLTARGKLSLDHADAATLLSASARPPVNGLAAVNIEVAGTGMSPVALVGSLKGTGKMTLADASLAGLDPRAFDAVTRAVDQGLPIESARISDIVAKSIESGRLTVKRAELPVTVAAGQIRLGAVTVEASDAAISIAGAIDLTDGNLDARLVLSGQSEAAGARPDIFVALKGPASAPFRTIDVSALTGWLTLRAVENQAKRLRAIENVPLQPAPKSKPAPALPAPIDIKPAPKPRSAGQGDVSIRSQN